MNSMDMDSQQKYTRDDYIYELENNFIDILEGLPISVSCMIIFQLDQAVAKSEGFVTESSERFTRGYFCSVLKRKSPKFYKAHYLALKDQPPLFFHLEFVDSDTYLDYINEVKKKDEVTNHTVSC